jgi:chromosome segregation ATPase
MMGNTESEPPANGLSSPPREKMRMLDQMADALEDQVAGLYRRAAAFEEEEFLLKRDVEERQTEINRLTFRLEVMRAERERVMERIESISSEAAAIREEVYFDK